MIAKIKELLRLNYNLYAQNVIQISPCVFLIDKRYILKKTNKKTEYIYTYLYSTNLENVILPLKTLSGNFTFNYNNELYYLMPFVENIPYPNSRKILELKNELSKLHKSTSHSAKLKINKIYKKLYLIYKTLNVKFSLIETFIREIEIKDNYDDLDLIFLNNYNFYLRLKQIMYESQKVIHKYLDEEFPVNYSLIHMYPEVTHFLSNNKKFLISFEKAKIGLPIIDIYRFYILNEDNEINVVRIVKEWLDEYNHPFYTNYFFFMTAYTYLLLIDDTSDKKCSIEKYLYVIEKIKKVLFLTEKKETSDNEY